MAAERAVSRRHTWAVGDHCTVVNTPDVVWKIVGFLGEGDRIADLGRPGWSAATSADVPNLRPATPGGAS